MIHSIALMVRFGLCIFAYNPDFGNKLTFYIQMPIPHSHVEAMPEPPSLVLGVSLLNCRPYLCPFLREHEIPFTTLILLALSSGEAVVSNDCLKESVRREAKPEQCNGHVTRLLEPGRVHISQACSPGGLKLLCLHHLLSANSSSQVAIHNTAEVKEHRGQGRAESNAGSRTGKAQQ